MVILNGIISSPTSFLSLYDFSAFAILYSPVPNNILNIDIDFAQLIVMLWLSGY